MDISNPGEAYFFTNPSNTAQIMKAVLKDRCQTLHRQSVA